MFVDPDHDPRKALPPGHGEKAVLAEYLDRYRMTLERRCEGLTVDRLATRSVPPSTMSLLGLSQRGESGLAAPPAPAVQVRLVFTSALGIAQATLTLHRRARHGAH